MKTRITIIIIAILCVIPTCWAQEKRSKFVMGFELGEKYSLEEIKEKLVNVYGVSNPSSGELIGAQVVINAHTMIPYEGYLWSSVIFVLSPDLHLAGLFLTMKADEASAQWDILKRQLDKEYELLGDNEGHRVYGINRSNAVILSPENYMCFFNGTYMDFFCNWVASYLDGSWRES